MVGFVTTYLPNIVFYCSTTQYLILNLLLLCGVHYHINCPPLLMFAMKWTRLCFTKTILCGFPWYKCMNIFVWFLFLFEGISSGYAYFCAVAYQGKDILKVLNWRWVGRGRFAQVLTFIQGRGKPGVGTIIVKPDLRPKSNFV